MFLAAKWTQTLNFSSTWIFLKTSYNVISNLVYTADFITGSGYNTMQKNPEVSKLALFYA